MPSKLFFCQSGFCHLHFSLFLDQTARLIVDILLICSWCCSQTSLWPSYEIPTRLCTDAGIGLFFVFFCQMARKSEVAFEVRTRTWHLTTLAVLLILCLLTFYTTCVAVSSSDRELAVSHTHTMAHPLLQWR